MHNPNSSPDITDRVQEAGPQGDEDVLYCTVHPNVSTSLRCNKCGRPMCTRCAVATPVGYRCKECVRGQQDVFFTATPVDYALAGGVSFVLALLASLIVPGLGLFFTIILAPLAGSLIAQAVRLATRRRRGRYLGYTVLAGVVVGSLPALWPLLRGLLLGVPLGALALGLLGPLLFIAIAGGVAYSWFRFGG